MSENPRPEEDPRHELPPPHQQHQPQYSPIPDPDPSQRAEDMARPDGESEPTETTRGTRIATNMTGNRRGSASEGVVPAEEKKPSRLTAFVAKLGLDAGTLITMFK